jgi:hypothetical protein
LHCSVLHRLHLYFWIPLLNTSAAEYTGMSGQLGFQAK